MKKKVTFIADCLVTQKAGIHYYAEQFIRRALIEYPKNDYKIILPSTYGQLDCEEVHIPINKYIPGHYRLRYFRQIPKKCIELKSDVVIEMAHFGPFNLPSNISTATIIHDITPITNSEWHTNSNSIGHKKFLPKVLKNSTHLITNSETTRQDLIKNFPTTATKVSVATPHLSISKRTRNPEIKKEKIILAVGTIEPRKNYNTLIAAYEQIQKQFPDYKLVIAGAWGWKSQSIKELIRNTQANIEVTGYIDESELNRLYDKSMLFVFPSLYEGYGLPLLEAMYHQLPIIGSDIPSTREVCEENILYFQKNNSKELAEKIMECLLSENKRERLSSSSISRFQELDKVGLGLDEIFN